MGKNYMLWSTINLPNITISPTIFLKRTDKLILNKSVKKLCEMIRSCMFTIMPEDQQVYSWSIIYTLASSWHLRLHLLINQPILIQVGYGEVVLRYQFRYKNVAYLLGTVHVGINWLDVIFQNKLCIRSDLMITNKLPRYHPLHVVMESGLAGWSSILTMTHYMLLKFFFLYFEYLPKTRHINPGLSSTC